MKFYYLTVLPENNMSLVSYASSDESDANESENKTSLSVSASAHRQSESNEEEVSAAAAKPKEAKEVSEHFRLLKFFKIRVRKRNLKRKGKLKNWNCHPLSPFLTV